MAWDPRQQGQELLKKLKGLDRKTLISGSIPFVSSVIILFLIGWQIKEIRRLKGELAGLDKQIAASLEAGKKFKGLDPKEKEEYSRLQAALVPLIPKEKGDIELAKELSRIASSRGMSAFTLKEPEKSLLVTTGSGSTPPPPPQGTETAGVNYFLLQISMKTQYRDLVYFLEEVSRLPRLLRIESLKATREYPNIKVEIVLRAFFSSGGIS